MSPLLDGTHFSKNILIARQASKPQSSHADWMLTELYIDVLLVDEELADMVWEAWDAGLISDDQAAVTWLASAQIAFQS